MDTPINNVTDLKAEIARLRGIEEQQSASLKARFNTPSALFHTAVSLFPKAQSQDLFGVLSKILLPLALNSTLFRNSNFIVKTLVGVLSQKASNFINEDSVLGIVSKVKSMFAKKDKNTDYGIPPLSETY